LKIPVEIPDSHLAGDINRITEIDLGDGLTAYVIGIEDLILDRAEQAYAQKSPTGEAKEQALILMAGRLGQLDWTYMNDEAEKRGIREYFAALEREARDLATR
jgi:hypothetical protein